MVISFTFAELIICSLGVTEVVTQLFHTVEKTNLLEKSLGGSEVLTGTQALPATYKAS